MLSNKFIIKNNFAISKTEACHRHFIGMRSSNIGLPNGTVNSRNIRMRFSSSLLGSEAQLGYFFSYHKLTCWFVLDITPPATPTLVF